MVLLRLFGPVFAKIEEAIPAPAETLGEVKIKLL